MNGVSLDYRRHFTAFFPCTVPRRTFVFGLESYAKICLISKSLNKHALHLEYFRIGLIAREDDQELRCIRVTFFNVLCSRYLKVDCTYSICTPHNVGLGVAISGEGFGSRRDYVVIDYFK
jgi:hypothetical protein